ncbi:MAG: ubiquitin-conjugating enzyme E2 variant [Candidatus Kariarchaeaceae archaeon]
MTYDPEQILAEEFQLMISKEPSFSVVNGDLRHWSGLVNQLTIDILLNEMHPFVSPVTKIRGSLKHPNINPDGTLSLQILDEWEPRYRIPDLLAAIRRLFSHSTPSSSPRTVSSFPSAPTYSSAPVSSRTVSDNYEQLQFDIVGYQEEIETLNEQLSTKRASLVKETASYKKNQLKSSPVIEKKAELTAVIDLLELIEVKYEEADIDQVEYVRLFKKYIKRKYILQNTI